MESSVKVLQEKSGFGRELRKARSFLEKEKNVPLREKGMCKGPVLKGNHSCIRSSKRRSVQLVCKGRA